MIERINMAEFARRADCGKEIVRRALRAGRIVRDADGLFDAAQLQTEWRHTNRRTARKREAAEPSAHPMMLDDSFADVADIDSPPDDETVNEAVQRIANNIAPHTRAEAERIKENFLAELRRLEFQVKSRRLVELAAVETEFYNVARSARDAWLSWPLTAGPILAADLGVEPDRVVTLLNGLVHDHIDRLGNPQPGFTRGQD
jgi:hypothetical protein